MTVIFDDQLSEDNRAADFRAGVLEKKRAGDAGRP
jgi:hypothetical protein